MSNKRAIEEPDSRNVKQRGDRVGQLEESMVHFYMEQYEEMKSRHRHAMAMYQHAEHRASRLYRDRARLANELTAAHVQIEQVNTDYNYVHDMLIEMASVIPQRIRRSFEGRINFAANDNPPNIVDLVTDEELTESD